MADTVDDLKKQVKILEKLVQSIQSQLWPLESEVQEFKALTTVYCHGKYF